MINYVVVGLVWCLWLEYFTTKNGMGTWVLRERLFHIALWPVSLAIFIIEFIKESMK